MKSIVFVMCLAGTAVAAPGDPTFDSLSMGRQTPISTLSFEFGYEVWDDPGAGDIDVWTVNLAGHFVNRRGIGAYAVVPLTYLDIQLPPLIDDSDLAIGNVEVGGIYTKFFGRTALLLHGGIALPTAQDDEASAFQPYGSFTRLADFPLRVTNSTWLRLGISPMGRSGNFLWRVDAGIDLALDEDNAIEYSPIFHVNLGGGVDLGSATLLAELVNVVADPDGNTDDSASTFAVGARFDAGNLRPGVGISLPIDFDDNDLYEWSLLGSLAVRM